MKDNFSHNSKDYSQYRPTYPQQLIDYLVQLVNNHGKLWDCGTGNGQLAAALAPYFDRVEATDISRQQIAEAKHKENITYTSVPAERTNFPDSSFDLVTVAQAVHWFEFRDFYREVKRVLKPGGVICITGYGLLRSNHQTNSIIDSFYKNTVGPYWDKEREYLEKEYKTIPFPFEEVKAPQFYITYSWTIEQLLGYLRTWSAVNHFRKAQQYDPVEKLEEPLLKSFSEKGDVSFPVLLRVGRI